VNAGGKNVVAPIGGASSGAFANLRATFRRSWPVLVSYGLFSMWGVGCLFTSLVLTSGGFGASAGDVIALGGVLAATVAGHVLGNVLGLVGLRLVPITILFVTLFVGASLSGLVLGPIALYLIVATFAAFGGYLGVASRLDVVASWYPLVFSIGGAVHWMNTHGAVATFHGGTKHAVWDPFTIVCLAGTVFFMLVFLATRHSLLLTTWQEVVRPRGAVREPTDAVAVARPGRGSFVVLFLFTIAVLGVTAIVSPYLFRTHEVEQGTGEPSKGGKGNGGGDGSSGKSGSGTSNGQGSSEESGSETSNGQVSDGESGSETSSGGGSSGGASSGQGSSGQSGSETSSGGGSSGGASSGQGSSGQSGSETSSGGASSGQGSSGKSGSGTSSGGGASSGESGSETSSGGGASGSEPGSEGGDSSGTSGGGTPGSDSKGGSSQGSGAKGGGSKGSGSKDGGSKGSGSKGGGSGSSESPIDKPDTDHAGSAAAEALNLGFKIFFWLLIAALLLFLVFAVFVPPLRRALLMRHLERPLWPVAPTARVMNLWRRALAVLATIDIEPAAGEAPCDFARRVEGELASTFGCPSPGLKEAAAIVEKIDYAGRGLGANDEQTMRQAVDAFVDAVSPYIPTKRKIAAAWGKAPEIET